jgi:hypothetical protein
MKTLNVTKAMSAKSDQLNADDLIAGPRVIRIRDVQDRGGEQPIWIFFDGDDNKPWKPSKTALRTLAAIWGEDAMKWVGMHCEIYNDEAVTWAGQAVGGIRVSKMEGLSSARVLKLTKTRGKKAAVTIEPLVIAAENKTDKIRQRLYAVVNGEVDLTLDEAWAKIPDDVKQELGDDFFDKLVDMQNAKTQAEKENPDADADELNNLLAAE